MALDKKLFKKEAAAAASGGATGNQEDGLILYYDANDVDSYDGDGSVWYDITNHEFTPEVDPAENFNTVTYSGNSSTQSITGVGFQPDVVWIKRRNSSASHYHFNSVVGEGKYFYTDTDAAGVTSSESGLFNSDGFTLASSNLGNNSSGTYVAWCMKAGGAPTATNTATSGAMTANSVSIDGELKSAYTPSGSPSDYAKKMSVNTKLGFSIVETGTYGTTAKSFAHGLGVKPEMVIAKSINDDQDWYVWMDGFNQNEYFNLNDAGAKATISGLWGSSAPHDANVIDWHGSNGHEYIFYSFASKRGVSKIGSYIGTGASGNKIYTGFEPAWLMIKSTGGGSWLIYDNKRDSSNPRRKVLMAHISNTEYSNLTDINFEADGFTIAESGGSNDNTGTVKYMYLAFAAEKPDGLIDDTDLELHLDADDLTSSSTTWSDKTSNDNDGTITGADFDAELGNWLDFDGSDDNVTITSTATSPIDPTGSFSAELWVYHDDLSGHQTYITKWGSTSASQSYIFGLDDTSNKPRLVEGTGSSFNTRLASTALVANRWYHLAVTSDSSEVVFYINGDEDNTISRTQTRITGGTEDTIIAKRASLTSQTLDGKIGQIRMYSKALTSDEVIQNYRFTKNDYPNGLNGTLNGLTSTDWNSGGYFDFPTGSDRIDLDFDGIDFNQTLVMWVNLGANTNADSNSTYRYYLYSQATSNDYQYFNVSIYDKSSGGNHLNIAWRDSSSSYYFLEDDVDDDFGSGWNMIAVYVAGTEEVYYSINGNDWTEATLGYGDYGTENVIPKGDVVLSRFQGNTNDLDQANPFSMSQLKVYDKVLTSSELSALNTAGYQG